MNFERFFFVFSLFFVIIFVAYSGMFLVGNSPPPLPQQQVIKVLPLIEIRPEINKYGVASLRTVRGEVKEGIRCNYAFNLKSTDTMEVRTIDAEHGVVFYTDNGVPKQRKFMVYNETIVFLDNEDGEENKKQK